MKKRNDISALKSCHYNNGQTGILKISQLPAIFNLLLIILSVNDAYTPYKDTDPDFAASVHHLKYLAVVEMHLLPTTVAVLQKELRTNSHANMISYIRDFTSSIVDPLNAKISLDQFVSLLQDKYISVDSVADDIVKHPLKSYRLIRRFVKLIKTFPEITQNPELMKKLEDAQEIVKFPKQSDVEGAIQNILRLKQIFKISTNDLLEGRLENLETKSGLSVAQLVEIGDHATILKMFSHAVDMYDGATQRCNHNLADEFLECSHLNLTDVAEKLNYAIIEHDKLVTNILENHEISTDLNVNPPDSSPYIFGDLLGNASSPDFMSRMPFHIDNEMETLLGNTNSELTQEDRYMVISPFLFEKLCGGKSLKTPAEKTSLRCYYMHKTHPTYEIGPLKVEIHNEDPYLIQIYEVITDKEIKDLQQEVMDEMRQSRTAATEGDDTGITSRFRTSANAWIDDNYMEKFKYLNERVFRITRLNTTGYFSSEMVQIAAYSPGGHYTPHSDAIFEESLINRLPETEFERGDRIVTFMIYLSDVEKGGGTGFPNLKTVVQPAKGSAVMWHNLASDGKTINYNVWHGGCPVLYGTKWTNKWIRGNDQMFIKKCPKNNEAWRL